MTVTPTDLADLAQDLSSESAIVFERAIVRRKLLLADENPAAVLRHALAFIEPLGARERERRVRRIVEMMEIDVDSLRQLARDVRLEMPWALNALLQVLPPSHRQLRQSIDVPIVGMVSRSSSSSLDVTVDEGGVQGVALLGLQDDHINNIVMLRDAGLSPLFISTVDMLEATAASGLCGVVVASSFWGQVGVDMHRRTLERICELSTIVFFKISTIGLSHQLSAELLDIHRSATHGEPAAALFGHGESAQLTPADIRCLADLATLQSGASEGAFYPIGLKPSQAQLLKVVLARRSSTKGRKNNSRTIFLKQLTGGKSGALVYLASPSGIHDPLVFKFDKRRELERELLAYKQWIDGWDGASAEPTFNAHVGTQALTYRLEAEPGAPDQPAETLQDRLEVLRSAIVWARTPEEMEVVRVQSEDILVAIRRAIDALSRLNHKSAGGTGDGFWLDWPINNAQNRGCEMVVSDAAGKERTVSAIVKEAAGRVQRWANIAVVHGDLHGRNVVLRDRNPSFIDFFASGPGHPCVDIVRLDGVVRTVLCRAVFSEELSVRMLYRLYVDGVSFDQISTEFPAFVSSLENTVWIKTAIYARSMSLKLADHYGGGLEDYLAVSAVVSSYILMLGAPGSSIERALLGAISTTAFA